MEATSPPAPWISSAESTTLPFSGSTMTKEVGPSPQPAVSGSYEDPQIGMIFNSEEEAYDFYNSYAKRIGFSVRKSHTERRKDGSIKARYFCCSKEGRRATHPTHVTKKPRPTERTNCKARVEFKVDRNKVWFLKKVVVDHNHPLASPDKAHLLRSHRKLLPVHRAVIEQMLKTGIKPSDMYDYFQSGASEAEKAPHKDNYFQGGGGGTEKTGFSQNDDCNNLPKRRARYLKASDAQIVLDYLRHKKSDDPLFFYAVQLDETGQIANFFWTDSWSIIDYSHFGDVVLFDTSFQMNNYEIPLAAFLGINHLKQTVVLGAALLFDDSCDTYLWLFRTFMIAMTKKQPKTIFTNHSPTITDAIKIVFPNTCHRLCLRHIFHNGEVELRRVFFNQPGFRDDFRNCIFECHSVDHLVSTWENLVKNYNLAGNSWLDDLFAIREKWAAVYHQDSFVADMMTAQRCENNNSLMKKFLYRKSSFSMFLEDFDKALKLFREEELYEGHRLKQTEPAPFYRDIPMLKEASKSYTPQVYKDFENEFSSQIACRCEPTGSSSMVHSYVVSPLHSHSPCLVEFNPIDITVACSCKRFECTGILCMHALRVLNHSNVFHLPSKYILKRWTRDAKDGAISGCQIIIDMDGRETMASLYARVCQKAFTLAVKGSVSRDALENLERGLDALSAEVDTILHGVPGSNVKYQNMLQRLQKEQAM